MKKKATQVSILTLAACLAAPTVAATQGIVRAVDERGAPPRASVAQEDPGWQQRPFDPGRYRPLPLPLARLDRTTPANVAAGRLVTFDVTSGRVTQAAQRVRRILNRTHGSVPGPRGPGATDLERGIGPANYDELSRIADASRFPYRMNVKLFVDFEKLTGSCSGVLIGPRHVLTAGHCVYNKDDGGYAKRVTVVPAFNGDATGKLQRPFGSSTSVQLHCWEGWIKSAAWEHDVALITLSRPVGALTSWFGYGFDHSCDFFEKPTWGHASYPGESPYDGRRMYFQRGSFDSCPNTLLANYQRRSYRGESGSGFYKVISGVRYAYAILSHGGGNWTGAARLDRIKFDDIGQRIENSRPTAPDLTPLAMASGTSVHRGERLQNTSFKIHNDSKNTFRGGVRFSVYLSNNRIISTGDRKLGDYSVGATIPPMATFDARWSGDGPLVPRSVPVGDYYLGVILTTSDANATNQHTLADDIVKIRVRDPHPTYSVHGPFGGDGGSTFWDTAPLGGRIVRVYGRAGSLLDGIGFVWEDEFGNQHQSPYRGGAGGKAWKFDIPAGDHLVTVCLRTGSLVDQLTLRTASGRQMTVGGNGGTAVCLTRSLSGTMSSEVVGFIGAADGLVHSLGVCRREAKANREIGGSGGSPFSFAAPPGHRIIRVYGSSANPLRAIGIVTEDRNGNRINSGLRGQSHGRLWVFDVPNGDSLSRIRVRADTLVNFLELRTAGGHTKSIGTDTGARQLTLGRSGTEIVGLYGRAGASIDQLGASLRGVQDRGPYGGEGGVPFSFHVRPGGRIVKIYGHANHTLRAIGIIWRDKDNRLHDTGSKGTAEGTPWAFSIPNGDALVSIQLRTGELVDQLVLRTLRGLTKSGGGTGGSLQREMFEPGHEVFQIRGTVGEGVERLGVLLRPSSLGHYRSFGVGCRGSRGVPVHTVRNPNGRPAMGSTTRFQLSRGPANSLAGWTLGLENDSWGPFVLPLELGPFGAPGCKLRVRADFRLWVPTDALGRAEIPLRHANDVSLIGFKYFTQFVTIDRPANALGLTYSNAIEVILGEQ